MAQNLIRGTTQILPGSIPLSALVSSYSIPTANLAQGSLFIQSGGGVAFTAAQSMGGFKLTNLGTPTTGTDAVTKSYADAIKTGFQIHFARLAATANLALTGEQTIDGVTTSASTILLTGQTTTSQNGLWTTAAGGWSRPADWAAAAVLPEGQYVIIDDEGTTYKNTKWFCLNTSTTTVDTTATTFSQDSSGTSYSATGVINLSGTVFSLNIGQGVENDGSNNLRVKLNGTSLARAAGGVSIAPGSAGQVPVTNAGATDVAMVSLSGDVAITSLGVATVSSTAGSGFLKYASQVTNEVPTGAVNSANTAYVIANTPQNASVKVYLNGQRLLITSDYTISGTTITMVAAPVTGDQIWVDYQK